MATRCPTVMKATARIALLRAIGFAVPLSVGSGRMPVHDALRVVDDLAASTAFKRTFDQTRSPFWGPAIAAPVKVACGDRDWILPAGSRRRNALPAHTR